MDYVGLLVFWPGYKVDYLYYLTSSDYLTYWHYTNFLYYCGLHVAYSRSQVDYLGLQMVRLKYYCLDYFRQQVDYMGLQVDDLGLHLSKGG